MYTPSSFLETNDATLKKFIDSYPLGLLMTAHEAQVEVSPLPFVVRQGADELVLVAHFARANPHWKLIESGSPCTIVFQGPDAYIAPSWYPGKAETHKVVPTWNYQLVEVKGQVLIQDDAQWLRTQIVELTQLMERDRIEPWQVSDAPEDFIDGLIKAIVGVEIRVTDIKGKFKLSQNRPEADQRGVIEGLENPQEPRANDALAQAMRAHCPLSK